MILINDRPVNSETARALREVMYDPCRCCNSDTMFYVANSLLRRSPKLTHANVNDLTEREALMVLAVLRELFPNQREAIRTRAAQVTLGTR